MFDVFTGIENRKWLERGSISVSDIVSTDVLVETKFYRPALPVDMVQRPRLVAYLKKRQESRPLTLVSAPAGYGKSTLVSCWLEHVDCPTAWLSLDEQDNNIATFLRYFLASIQTIFPDKLLETGLSLTSMQQPSTSAIATSLVNEINQIKEFFILVLDDYYLIQEQAIHDLINELLLHPPPNLHLVITTRIDPPLSLVTLRGKGWLTEVRIPGLRFNREESIRLFNKMTGVSIDEDSLAEIDAKAEGWVTGLRLAALAMRHRIGRENLDLKLTLNNRYVSEYLLSEILAKQTATFSDCMLKTSILSRFCADLCEALCFTGADSSGAGSAESDFNGYQFLEWLRTSNLFIIPLDDQDKWYRYHHIFREFLQQELVRRFGQEEIGKLHAVAGRWFADNNLIDEAFYHLLPSGEIPTAIELVAQHRYELMNDTKWLILENWLNLFQDHVIQSSLELWMLKTWLAYHHGRWTELPNLLKRLDTMLADEPDQEKAAKLTGEIQTLRSMLVYLAGDAESAISHARAALELLPPELWIVRVLARLYLGGGLLMLGDKSSALQVLYNSFGEEPIQNDHFKATTLSVACNIHWQIADLQGMRQAASESIALSQKSNCFQILGNSQAYLGFVYYQYSNLPAAVECFTSVVGMPYHNYGTAYINSICGLSMTYQALGKEAEARQVIEDSISFLLGTGNSYMLPSILATQAELALKQGNLAAAKQWAANLGLVPPLRPMYGLLAPHLVLAKVWLAQDTPASQAKASELLLQLREYLEKTYNTRFLIETLALQALQAQSLGDQDFALATLEQALRLAQAGGFIRVFVDEGPGMARLFTQLEVDDDLRDYVGKIRSAFPALRQTREAMRQGELLDPLTDRELQILELLQERLSNNEIAAQLVISSGTVKGHTIKIYQKLDVNGRRQAVDKAVELGLLMPA